MTARRETARRRADRPGARDALLGLRPARWARGTWARATGARARWAKRATAGVATAALVVTTFGVAHSATPGVELLVDSLGTAADANPGDGVCATEAGACTLRAAIEESNALNLAAGVVRVGVHPDLPDGRINLTTDTSTWMSTTRPSATGGSITDDRGSVFEVTAPVEIDLENRILPNAVTTLDGPTAAIFHVNGPDITLRNISQAWGGETTFYVGPLARNAHITGGDIRTANYWPERFVIVRGGAQNVTISDYTVAGFASRQADWGYGFVDGATTAATAVQGLTIRNVRYLAEATSGRCNATRADGCTSSVMNARNQHVTDLQVVDSTMTNHGRSANNSIRMIDLRNATVGSFVFARNTITDPRIWSGFPMIEMGGTTATAARVTDFEIVDNVVTGITAASEATGGMIRLPENTAVPGSGLIARNTFEAASGQMQAVYWLGPRTNALNVTPSGVRIEDNHFDGWGATSARSTIRLWQTGAVTVQRNTYGARTGAQTNTVAEEGTTADATVLTMVNNRNLGANGKVNTWFPTARTSGNAQAEPLVAASCAVDLEVAPPTSGGTTISGARNPALPTTLDVYWTASNRAEVYLESVTVNATGPQTLSVALPLAGDERLAHLPDGAALPVHPETGAVTGGLRLQTHDPNAGATAASSQLSRVATIAGTCRPELSIDQAEGQNDPTLARDLHWTVRSTLPLVEDTLTVDAITLTAEPTVETIDPERINARVVSVTPVAGSGGTRFTVVARADDSAVLRVGIEAGTVTSESGWVNDAPATSTDAEITFVNPLVVDPATLALVAGKEAGKDYRITTRAGAPVPAAELRFTATPDAAAQGHGVALGTPAPTIAAGATATGPLNVTAPPGEMAADTPVRVRHDVTSADPGYDALVVPDLDLRLFSTDPVMEITKRAYFGVTDSSSPASIIATGTEAPLGTRLMEGQAVCWVYTVTNISEDDWATALTDLEVTDTDTRLGRDGVIGVVPRLAIGETQQLSACAVLIPGDTRTAG